MSTPMALDVYKRQMLVFLSAALPYLATVAVVYMLVRFTFRKKRHERSNEK